jgi:hypothetical protein
VLQKSAFLIDNEERGEQVKERTNRAKETEKVPSFP